MGFTSFHALDSIQVCFQSRVDGAHGAVISVTQVGGVTVPVEAERIVVGLIVDSTHWLIPFDSRMRVSN